MLSQKEIHSFVSKNQIINRRVFLLTAAKFVLFATIAMWLSAKLSSKLGPTVITVVQKIFGLLLGALAIEFVIDGVINSFNLNQ